MAHPDLSISAKANTSHKFALFFFSFRQSLCSVVELRRFFFHEVPLLKREKRRIQTVE